jgi:hypothetical protein
MSILDFSENIMQKFLPLSRTIVRSGKIQSLVGGASEFDIPSDPTRVLPEDTYEIDWEKVKWAQVAMLSFRGLHIGGAAVGTGFSYFCERTMGKFLPTAQKDSDSDKGLGGGGLTRCNVSKLGTGVASAIGLGGSVGALHAKLLFLSPHSETRWFYTIGLALTGLACFCIAALSLFNLGEGVAKHKTEHLIEMEWFSKTFGLGNNLFKSFYLLLGSCFTLGMFFYLIGTIFDWGENIQNFASGKIPNVVYQGVRTSLARAFAVQLLITFLSVWTLIAAITTAHSESKSPTFIHNITQPMIACVFIFAGAIDLIELKHINDKNNAVNNKNKDNDAFTKSVDWIQDASSYLI